MDDKQYPFDIIDLGLMLLAPAHPVFLIVCVLQWAGRRSGWVLQAFVDAGVEIPDTPPVRAVLPGLAKLLPSPADVPTAPAPVAGVAPPVTEPAPSLPFIELDRLAASRNILLVGSPGSGKTTLLRAILQRRGHPVFVVDPHAAPNDWPGAKLVIGAGRKFQEIYTRLLQLDKQLTHRAELRARGEQTSFPAMTLAGDEWGSVCSEISISKDQDTPGKLLIRLLKEGRKFGINAVLSAHGDTAASVGSSGDTMAFRLSFDWIVYCGGYVRQWAGDEAKGFPQGRTPEGNNFPLIVCAVCPATDERMLLDMRGLDTSTTHAPNQPHTTAHTGISHTSMDVVFADTDAVSGAGIQTGMPSKHTDMDTDLIDALIAAGWSANKIYKKVGGNRNAVLAYIARQRTAEDDPDVGPFGKYLDRED